MRDSLKLLLSLLIIALTVETFYASNGKCGENVTWNLSRDGVLVFSGSGPMKDFGKSQPYNPKFVKRVLIEEGVTSIGHNTFRNCKNLIDVSISNTVKFIGEHAFHGCTNLSYIIIPNSVEKIGVRAFSGCKSLSSLEIKFGCIEIETESFLDCSSLATISIPESVRIIGMNAFKGCSFLNNITELPTLVTAQSSMIYGLNTSVVSKYWSEKERKNMYTDNNQNISINQSTSTELGKGADIKADIDLFVPHTDNVNDNTFVVIIANEVYQKLAKVNYAIKDGHSFAQYCQLTLGIPYEKFVYIKMLHTAECLNHLLI